MDATGYHEEFRLENGILYVRLSGTFPKELLRTKENVFQPLIEASSKNACTRALIDARDLQVDFDTMALFQAGEDAASLTRLGLSVALLAREDMLDRFFDDVAFNRGAYLGIFTDLDAARDWLQHRSARKAARPDEGGPPA